MTGISVVLVNHDGGRTVPAAIRALKQQDHPIHQIIVVDTASTDGSPELIRSTFPDVTLIRSGRNAGPGPARNLGLSLAETEFVLWLDDDIYLDTGCLSSMIRAQQETHAAVVCPRIVFYPERDLIQCDGAGIHFCGTLSLLNTRQPHGSGGGRTFPNGFGSACLLVDREVLSELGGFDESFFFYFEDLELSYRLRARGHLVCCEENAVAFHDLGRGEADLAFRGNSAYYPVKRVYYLLRHRWMTIAMHYQVRTLIMLLPALVLYEAASFMECLRRGWLLHWFKAVASVLKNMPILFRKRSKYQNARKVPDRELLMGGALPFAAGFVNDRIVKFLVAELDHALNAYWQGVRSWL